MKRIFPGREADLAPVKAEQFRAQGKFAEAEEKVLAIPANTPQGQEARLKLGNYYYASSEIDKAKALYEDYFRQYKDNIPTDEGLLKAYRDAAYILSIMLSDAGDYQGAIDNADRVLRTKPEPNPERLALKIKIKNLIQLAKSDKGRAKALVQEVHTLTDTLGYGGIVWGR